MEVDWGVNQANPTYCKACSLASKLEELFRIPLAGAFLRISVGSPEDVAAMAGPASIMSIGVEKNSN